MLTKIESTLIIEEIKKCKNFLEVFSDQINYDNMELVMHELNKLKCFLEENTRSHFLNKQIVNSPEFKPLKGIKISSSMMTSSDELERELPLQKISLEDVTPL